MASLRVMSRVETVRDQWRVSTALEPVSRLKVALSAAVPRFAPDEITLELATGSRLILRCHSTDLYVFSQIFQWRQYDLDLPVGTPIRLIVDAGAYTGLSTIFFSERFPKARIIAIEPDAENFALLLRNIAGRPNITAVNAALWYESADLALEAGRDQGAWSLRARMADGDEPCVPAITMSDLIATHCGDAAIDLLKLDIEGAECELLARSTAWMPRVQAIAAELHPDLAPDVVEVFAKATRGFVKTQADWSEVTLAVRSATC
jgi:FkbM family methyltransferase